MLHRTVTTISLAVYFCAVICLQGETVERLPTPRESEGGATSVASQVSGDPSGADGSELGDLDCSTCCEWPRWTVKADAVFLTRRVGPASLISDFTSGTEVLSASDLDLSSLTGLDLALTRHWVNGNALEFRYVGADSWTAQTLEPTNAGNLLQIQASVPLFNLAGSAVDAHYASRWHSFELNGRRELWQGRLSLLAGVRYTQLDEAWGFDLIGGTPPLQLETATRNRLWGGQLGGTAVLWDRGGRLSVEADGKAGVYSNRAAQNGLLNPAGFQSNDAETSAAFLGELGLTGNYRLTERLSIRGGYRLVWINGVALAPEQLAVRDAFGQGIDTSGEAFLHGAFVGLQFVY